MSSLRANLFFIGMKLMFKYLMPAHMPLESQRKFACASVFEGMPRGVTGESRTVNGVTGEWITPATVQPQRILLYCHGGGYVLSSPRIHRVLVGRLAQATRCTAFMVDYRLAPEYPFPAALEDVLAAYQGLLTAGYTPAQIAVAGDSAGGGLTAALLLSLRDTMQPLPAAACLLSPMLDCTFSDESIAELQKHDPYLRLSDFKQMAQYYCGDHTPHDPLISPVLAPLHGLSPLLIYAGEREILRSDATRFAGKARRDGTTVTLKVWPGMVHAFPIYARFLPEGQAAIAEIGAFFRQAWQT